MNFLAENNCSNLNEFENTIAFLKFVNFIISKG